MVRSRAALISLTLVAVGLLLSGQCVADAMQPRPEECDLPILEGAVLELGIADRVGRALLFPASPEFGVQVTVRCLSRMLDVEPRSLDASVREIAIGMLLLMSIYREWFFHELDSAPSRSVANWLEWGLPSAESQYIGDCPNPDIFEQARKALVDFDTSSPSERRLLTQIDLGLKSRKCRIP
jgi:hypothetical protein